MRYKITIDAEHCKGCRLCVEICPKKVLGMGTKLNGRGVHFAVVAHGAQCIGCLQCCDICPDTVIEIEQESEKA